MGAGRPRGLPKTGGRKPGSLNKRTLAYDANEVAERLGIDPFLVLLFFCNGDWHKLGYTSPTRIIRNKDGSTYEVDVITPDIRLNAAKEATQYLLPKRQAVSISADVNMELARKAEEYSMMSKEEHIQLMEAEIKRLKGE